MTRRTVGRWLLRGLVALVLVYFGVALGLSAWPAPGVATPADGSPEAAAAQGLSLEQVYPFEERHFTTRDGETLYSRFFPSEDPSLTLLIVQDVLGVGIFDQCFEQIVDLLIHFLLPLLKFGQSTISLRRIWPFREISCFGC